MAMLLNAMEMSRSMIPDDEPRFKILRTAETPVIKIKSNVAANELRDSCNDCYYV